MNMISLENTLIELERQVSAATGKDEKLALEWLRSLTASLEPKPTSREIIFEEDDLLFDNVPV